MMNSYINNLKRKDLIAVSRIYESILYAFTSPVFSCLHKNVDSFAVDDFHPEALIHSD